MCAFEIEVSAVFRTQPGLLPLVKASKGFLPASRVMSFAVAQPTAVDGQQSGVSLSLVGILPTLQIMALVKGIEGMARTMYLLL